MTEQEKEQIQNDDTRRLVRRKSFCAKSPTGQHEWVPSAGGYVCKFCQVLTEEEILVD
jgi:hypothetical protein